MIERLRWHFEPKNGWMNDPNGLVWFAGKYHAFFQHNPAAPWWEKNMHWGHAVSDDLVHWDELPIALFPDRPYENDGGCYSGSAVVRDGVLYLLYTSVSAELGQTQSLAMSRDGVTFEKYAGNPVIRSAPPEGSADFRDPKVFARDGMYYMVLGSGRDGVGKILLYRSRELTEWEYVGVLFEGAQYGGVLECPDLFRLGDRDVLCFSKLDSAGPPVQFVIGRFDGRRFHAESECSPERGPHFYAPQSFLDPRGRRIMIGWLTDWGHTVEEGAPFAGALTIPRELTLRDGVLRMYPVEEARAFLTGGDALLELGAEFARLVRPDPPVSLEYRGRIDEVAVLRDTRTLEVFLNGGECSFTYRFANSLYVK